MQILVYARKDQLLVYLDQLALRRTKLDTLKKNVDGISNNQVSSKDSLESTDKPLRDTRSFGGSEVEVLHALDTSSQIVGFPEKVSYDNNVHNMTSLLDAVLNYMQAISDDLRNNAIAYAKRFREEVGNKNAAGCFIYIINVYIHDDRLSLEN